MPLAQDLVDLFHWIGSGAGTASGGAIALVYARFRAVEGVAKDFATLVDELRAFPLGTHDDGRLVSLKKYIDAARAQVHAAAVGPQPATQPVPRPTTSGLNYAEAKRLSEFFVKVDDALRRVHDLEVRQSAIEDDVDNDRKDQGETWSTIKEDLAWLKGKLNLPRE